MHHDPIKSEGRDRIALIDLSIYGLEAILKSTYRFTGRSYIHLQHAGATAVEVRMRPKQLNEDPDVTVREFFNDLLDQRLRSVVAAETVEVRTLIMAHALSRSNFVRPDLETADPITDPCHVSIPDRKNLATP